MWPPGLSRGQLSLFKIPYSKMPPQKARRWALDMEAVANEKLGASRTTHTKGKPKTMERVEV